MEKIKKELIVKLVELNLLIDLFNINNTNIQKTKFEIMGLMKDLNILTGKANSEVIKDINAIIDFNKKECKALIDSNLKILFWDNE